MAPLERVANRPTWLLSRANARAQALLHEAFAAHGARGYQFRLLAALDQHGPTSQADLGRHTGIDRSDVTTTLDELAADALVRRHRDPDDGRRNVVTLTAAGRRRLGALDRVLDGVQEEVLSPLADAERRTLLRLLAELG